MVLSVLLDARSDSYQYTGEITLGTAAALLRDSLLLDVRSDCVQEPGKTALGTAAALLQDSLLLDCIETHICIYVYV